MFKRAEVREWNKRFYTTFGIYMRKHTPQSDFKLKWLNYKTGIKSIFFKVEASKRKGVVAIDITYSDAGMRELFFEQFVEFKKAFDSYVTGEWIWDKEYYLDNGQTISRIYIQKEGINVFKEDDWGAFFYFFEKHLVELDNFWTDFKEGFRMLAE